jgi:hypothetical protein
VWCSLHVNYVAVWPVTQYLSTQTAIGISGALASNDDQQATMIHIEGKTMKKLQFPALASLMIVLFAGAEVSGAESFCPTAIPNDELAFRVEDAAYDQFAGVWNGHYVDTDGNKAMCMTLIIVNIDGDGGFEGFYTWGDYAPWRYKAGTMEISGELRGGTGRASFRSSVGIAFEKDASGGLDLQYIHPKWPTDAKLRPFKPEQMTSEGER